MNIVTPKKLGIRFSDNDFSTVVITFIRLLSENMFCYQKDETSEQLKDRVKKIFKLSVGGIYVAAQNQLTYGDIEHTIKYLEEHEVYVYIDDEVDSYIHECEEWDNGEFFIIDFTNSEHENGYIYSI